MNDDLLLTRQELLTERELHLTEIKRLQGALGRCSADKATFARWYATAIKEVTRLRDEIDMVSK
jgi:hypothetical protein